MNLVYDHSEHIHEFKRHLTNSVSESHVSNLKFWMMNFFEKEMIFWTVDFGQAVSVSIYLISDWTFWRFGVSREVWIWLHLDFGLNNWEKDSNFILPSKLNLIKNVAFD